VCADTTYNSVGIQKFGQSRDKKTSACDNTCLAQVDQAPHKAVNSFALVRAQLLENNTVAVEVVVACYWR